MPGIIPLPSATEVGSASRFEAIISSSDDGQRWVHEGGSEPTDYEVIEPRFVDRFAIFSSPTAFWAATICLAVATTILLGLICTFVLIAFRRRSKPAVDGGRPPPGSLYSAAMENVGVPRSACMSINESTLPSCDSKALRLAPYPENTANKKVRICYSGSPTDASFYDWPQVKLDPGRKTPALMHQPLPQEEASAYQYGRMRLRDVTAMSPEIVLNGFEVYQPLLAIANNTGGGSTATWIHSHKHGISSKGSDKTASDSIELTAATDVNNNLNGGNLSKSTTSLHVQKFETSFV
ncbi:unnamed protein product [Hydatigera taeniaeformis]|uniref:Uncharacterized protein n=1 Tax=Hydatigena taeniaeformis TaxID=6205 RepID=A0A3P7G5U2_HYDTA|nr:unnamed protein product [Hydatigera taeniaeformis]